MDQSRLGGNARSTVGTISEMYSSLRLLFSRIGEPKIGPASYFSFNNPNGMCKTCAGIGKVMDLNIEAMIDPDKSFEEGMLQLPAFGSGKYYWRVYNRPDLFDVRKKWRDFTEREKNILLYGSETVKGERLDKRFEGVKNQFERLCLMKGAEEESDNTLRKINTYMTEIICPDCQGRRLSPQALSCKIQGYSIHEMCEMEFTKLREVLAEIQDPRGRSIVDALIATLDRMSRLLKSLRDRGNTVLVVEHDKDIISIADEVIDVGPLAGRNGGQILFQGSYEQLLCSGTRTGEAMKQVLRVKADPRKPNGFLPIRNAAIHNLRNVDVDIPLGVMTVVTGVAGSGKSSLIRDVFAKQYEEQTVIVDQSAITATGRSTACTFMGFFDDIRALLAKENGVDKALFSFNSKGACPVCKGRGMITTELVFMEPVTTVCEACEGKRYSREVLDKTCHGKNIVEILEMSVEEAREFFAEDRKIRKQLDALMETGLPYLSLGQPLSTLSGGEIVFTGTPQEMIDHADTITAKYLRKA